MDHEKAPVAYRDSYIIISICQQVVRHDIMEKHPVILAETENIRGQIKEKQREQ